MPPTQTRKNEPLHAATVAFVADKLGGFILHPDGSRSRVGQDRHRGARETAYQAAHGNGQSSKYPTDLRDLADANIVQGTDPIQRRDVRKRLVATRDAKGSLASLDSWERESLERANVAQRAERREVRMLRQRRVTA